MTTLMGANWKIKKATMDTTSEDEGNFQGFFHPLEVLGTVVETDDGLGTGGDAQQNGNHDLVDLHHR